MDDVHNAFEVLNGKPWLCHIALIHNSRQRNHSPDDVAAHRTVHGCISGITYCANIHSSDISASRFASGYRVSLALITAHRVGVTWVYDKYVATQSSSCHYMFPPHPT